MPKKSASARGGAQRNKPRVQKNIELVRPTTVSDELALETNDTTADAETTTVATSVETMIAPKTKSSGATRTRTRGTTTPKVRESSALVATPEVKKEEKGAEEQEEGAPVVSAASAIATPATPMAPKSAAARLAARRQSGQKNSPRSAVALITSEHYSYVRKDLAFIAVLAIIMFAAIIILHFVPGIGS